SEVTVEFLDLIEHALAQPMKQQRSVKHLSL
ncbi:MAG: hypothetical protein RL708_2244, partial [Bacteroidota bacterium]